MPIFCDCEDALSINENHNKLFIWHPPYGWLLSVIELSEEKGYTQVHRYGVVIHYCPMCGKEIVKSN
jgi:hypothetical protein